MLRLFAGRENIDKERFIYDRVRECGGETLVIVPDQYTLVAEEQALKYMGADCLFSTEIISMSRLGLRLLTEQGTESVDMLDRYGRFMLLTRLIKEHAGDFDIFRRSAGKQAFTTMLSDFISEFKQQECTLDEMTEMLGSGDADPILRAKLEELRGVIDAYEEAVSGKYTDSEDYISMYIEAIGKSQMIRDKNIWIYGYDSITPKFTRAMLELSTAAKSVSFILNRSDFGLDEQMEGMLRAKCREMSVPFSCEEIGPEYETGKSETVRRIERGLWNDRLSAEERAENRDFAAEDLTVVCAANPYYEAESAAAYIWHLVRDLGCTMSPMNAYLTHQGLQTLDVRMERHVKNAQAVAEFLSQHPMVDWIIYPGLKGNKYYDLAQKYLPKGASAVMSFGVKGGREAGEKFLENLELCSIVVHVGDIHTSVLHPASTTHRQLSEEAQLAAGIDPGLIRLSVGLESADDIIADLDQALNKVR